jgi:hypothetical protein
MVGERVDNAVIAEESEGAIDGGEADCRLPVVAEARPELLCGGVVGLACELGEDSEPLSRGPQAFGTQALGEIGLPR